MAWSRSENQRQRGYASPGGGAIGFVNIVTYLSVGLNRLLADLELTTESSANWNGPAIVARRSPICLDRPVRYEEPVFWH